MDYLIGDLQGCCDPLEHLLATIDFSPSRDRIHLLGDLVNRGPQSLPVLQRLVALGDAAQCLLGNHDLHLLAVAHGVRKPGKGDTLDAILADPQRDALLDWLRHRRHGRPGLRLAAGARRRHPAMERRRHARARRRDRGAAALRRHRRVPAHDVRQRAAPLGCRTQGPDRWRFIVNVLTRMRLCSADGELELKQDAPGEAAARHAAVVRARAPPDGDTPIAFGHWSQLGLVDSPLLLSTDTGCLWGGSLTAVRVDDGHREVFQVKCPQARKPG